MNVTVTLAGYPAAWRFRGSAELEAGLASQPWRQSGGILVVRIASPQLAHDLARAIRRSVRGHDDGDSDVQVSLVDPSLVATGLTSTFTQVLELPAGLERREFLTAAARALAVWPQVFILPAVSDGVGPRLFSEARELLEQARRIDSSVRATFIFIDTPAAPLCENACDLTVGGMADPVLGDLERKDQELWRGYVHARLAWETAGDLARALTWDERGFRNVGFSQDNLLENLLNQCAESEYAVLPEAIKQQAIAYLRQMIARRDNAAQGKTTDLLLRAGAFWRPPGESQPRPTPWLSRGMLRTNACPDAGFYLRGSLVCTPLAREVLSHCFDLEARQRAIGWANRGTFRPQPEAEERYRRFLEKQVGSGADFYPLDCPAAPVDGWAFTVFGEFIASLPLDPKQIGVHHDLRNLRNALAHGHYISWTMLTTLRRIERQLSV